MTTSFNVSGAPLYLVQSLLVRVFIFCALIAGAPAAFAQDDFPASLAFGDTTLSLNGEGKRKKAIISLYRAGLYLEQPSGAAQTIVASDAPMAIRLVILSRFISAEKMQEAMQEGFAKSTGGDTALIAEQIVQFESGFSDEISKQDQFDLVYRPGQGTEVIKNGDSKVTVEGLAFKQALFGIWLSDDPVQGSLKSALLGK